MVMDMEVMVRMEAMDHMAMVAIRMEAVLMEDIEVPTHTELMTFAEVVAARVYFTILKIIGQMYLIMIS